jgi:hypothetical protein
VARRMAAGWCGCGGTIYAAFERLCVKSGACVRNVHDTQTIHSAIRDLEGRADIVVSIAGCVAPVPLHCAVSRYALCKNAQCIYRNMNCDFWHKAYLLTAS